MNQEKDRQMQVVLVRYRCGKYSTNRHYRRGYYRAVCGTFATRFIRDRNN